MIAVLTGMLILGGCIGIEEERRYLFKVEFSDRSQLPVTVEGNRFIWKSDDCVKVVLKHDHGMNDWADEVTVFMQCGVRRVTMIQEVKR